MDIGVEISVSDPHITRKCRNPIASLFCQKIGKRLLADAETMHDLFCSYWWIPEKDKT